MEQYSIGGSRIFYNRDGEAGGRDFCPHGNGIWYEKTPFGERRTKYSHPYGYDAFFIFGNHESITGCGCDYTDRYQLWDQDKYRAAFAAMEDDSTRWDRAGREKVDKFVKVYYGPQYEVTGLVEWCNQSSGFSLWSIHFKEV